MEQHLVVAPQWHRHLLQVFLAYFGADLGAIGLKLHGIGSNFDDLGHLANREVHIHAGDVIHRDRYPCGSAAAESIGSDFDSVSPGRHRGKAVGTCFVRLAAARSAGLFVGDDHLRSGNHGAGAVAHVSDDAAVEDLRL